jgi:hypothetical protein
LLCSSRHFRRFISLSVVHFYPYPNENLKAPEHLVERPGGFSPAHFIPESSPLNFGRPRGRKSAKKTSIWSV